VGGLLIGALPNPMLATLSIDEVGFIPRQGSGLEYIVGSGFQMQLMQAAENARRRGKQLVGFFRSNMRGGMLSPGENDRLFMSLQFRHPAAVLLLLQGRAPHTAALYVCTDGQVPETPTVREFQLDEREFRSLPEIYRDPGSGAQEASSSPARTQLYVGLGIAAILLLVLLGLVTGVFTGGAVRLGGNQVGLNVSARARVLAITWDHSARAVRGAHSATLQVTDGASAKEISLGADDLRLGSVDYEPVSSAVQVTLTIRQSGRAPVQQSSHWNGPLSLP
jgi:hypothetical protein